MFHRIDRCLHYSDPEEFTSGSLGKIHIGKIFFFLLTQVKVLLFKKQMSADLRKGSLRHSSNYYIRDI